MGGEKIASARISSSVSGSPPHGRGKAAHPLLAECWHGDHPRVGGEKTLYKAGCGPQKGSPPRGRGKDKERWATGHGEGITPAWAGKRRCTRLDAGHRRDHPRVGGEKIKSGGPLDTARGSPPRGRGKAEQQAYEQLQSGITPAQAGKSRPSPASEMPTKDYPRVGGEKIRQSIWYRTT